MAKTDKSKADQPDRVKLKAPDAGASITIEGETFEADEDGFVHIPHHLAGEAMAHGYSAPAPAQPK